MRVRHLAVVGAAMAVAWVGGAGIAQATPISSSLEHRAIAQVGCTIDDALLEVRVPGGLPAGSSARLVVDGAAGSFLPINVDGSADLIAIISPDATVVVYTVELRDGSVVVSDSETVEDICTDDATVTATRDCADVETLTLVLAVRGLEPDAEYAVDYESDGFAITPGDDGNPYVTDTFETDSTGSAVVTTTVTEGADVSISSGAFDVDYYVYGDEDIIDSAVGTVHVAACSTQGGTQPGGTTPTPTTTPAPTTTVPVAAAPVVVTHPAAAKPAVLANTGAPVTAAALLGGGLLLVGAGAMLATRRRAS